MKILQASYSACGKRSENQDSLLVKGGASGVLAVVADGVGGSEHGELASSGRSIHDLIITVSYKGERCQ